MKIGVNGASGQLGREVIKALEQAIAPENLVAISRTPKADGTYERRKGDYDQPETLNQAYRGLDRLLLIPGPDLRPGIRSRQMLAALDAAECAEVGHVFLLSATGAQDETEPEVGAAYWHSEQRLIKGAIPAWTILRMSYFSETLAEEARMSVDTGSLAAIADSRVSFVSRDDVAKAAAVALTRKEQEGAIWNLTGPEAVSGTDVSSLISEVTGHAVALNVMTADALRDGLRQAGLPDFAVEAVVSMKQRQARGAYDIVTGDIERLTGDAPRALQDVLLWELGTSK